MASAWPVFPLCPTFGFTSAPDYSVTVVERSGGVRTVNRNWYYPLHTYTAVPMGDRPEEDIYRLQRFWHAVGGRSGRFLYDDLADRHTALDPADDPSPLDQPAVYDDTSPAGWQLFKTYDDDSGTPLVQSRIIQKPREVMVAIDGVELAPSAYTVDWEWGRLTFVAPPDPQTAVVTWGGFFYVPVMFETLPEVILSEFKIRQSGFALRELRLPR